MQSILTLKKTAHGKTKRATNFSLLLLKRAIPPSCSIWGHDGFKKELKKYIYKFSEWIICKPCCNSLSCLSGITEFESARSQISGIDVWCWYVMMWCYSPTNCWLQHCPSHKHKQATPSLSADSFPQQETENSKRLKPGKRALDCSLKRWVHDLTFTVDELEASESKSQWIKDEFPDGQEDGT